MLIIKNARTLTGSVTQLEITTASNQELDANGLTVLPALIDPHVHFRTPGLTYKENWQQAAKAALAGGYTTVFDMPNTIPPTITETLLKEKKALIDQELQAVGIPLHYQLFFGADKNHLQEIPLVKNQCIGIKVFMGCSTGNLVIDDDESLHAVFKIAAEHHMLVAVHAEDESLLKRQKTAFKGPLTYAAHSEIRSEEVAVVAVKKAIELTQLYGTRLYILHVSTEAELKEIAKAKAAGLPVFAETTPHHLFLDTSRYAHLQGKAVVNPPLRHSAQHERLFAAIHAGIIDTIGSDHAPHTLAEKAKPYGECPSGMPGIETTLPLLLNACHEGKLSLEEVVSLTSTRARAIFDLPANQDIVLVDLELQAPVFANHLNTLCGWSPFEGEILKGWPVYTILAGKVYSRP